APGALRPAPGLWLLRDAIGGGWSRRAGFAPGYRRARAPEPASGLSRSTAVPGPDTPATTDTGRQRGGRRPQSPRRSARRGRASGAGHTGPARAARGYTRAPHPHEKTRYSPALGGPPGTAWGRGAVRPGRGVPPPAHAPSGTALPHDSNTTAPTAPEKVASSGATVSAQGRQVLPPLAVQARRPGYRRVLPLGPWGP